MKYNRFLPLLVPGLVFLLLEVFYFKPKLIYVILVLIILLYFFTVRQFLVAVETKEKLYNFILLPAYFTIGLVTFSTMVPRESGAGKFLLQLFFVLNAGFVYLYLRSIYHYINKHSFYKKYSLKNISSYGNFLAFYFLVSSVYGLQSFLNTPIWLLMMALLIFSGMIIHEIIWSNQINTETGLFYMLIFCLVIIELSWSVSFLTLSYYVLGLIMAVCYYIFVGLLRFYLLGNLNKKIIKLYLIFGSLSLVLVLFTARWI